MDRRTLILIPAYNEGRKIGGLLADIVARKPDSPVLVVDDGSRDDTASVARVAGAAVLSHAVNRGYGAALLTGYRFALSEGYARVIQLDADGQHDPDGIERIERKLDQGYDLVLGSRFLDRSSYRPSFARRLGIRVFSTIATFALHQKITDATTGFQGLSRRLLAFYDRRARFPRDYPDANILIRAGRAGHRLTEVPVRMRENPEGGTLHVGWKPIRYVFKMSFAILVELTRRLPPVDDP